MEISTFQNLTPNGSTRVRCPSSFFSFSARFCVFSVFSGSNYFFVCDKKSKLLNLRLNLRLLGESNPNPNANGGENFFLGKKENFFYVKNYVKKKHNGFKPHP